MIATAHYAASHDAALLIRKSDFAALTSPYKPTTVGWGAMAKNPNDFAGTTRDLASMVADAQNGGSDRVMERLADQEKAKRSTLAVITESREVALAKLMDLQDRVFHQHSHLKRKERLVLAQAGQLLKALKDEEGRVNVLSTIVHRLHKQRKQQLTRITEPSWAVPHHYHMTAVEHAMGHTQPHVLDVGSMIRGHLRLFAMGKAKCVGSVSGLLVLPTLTGAVQGTLIDAVCFWLFWLHCSSLC